VKKIIRNIFAVVLAFAVGTVIIYGYGSYNECRCNQASPGIALSLCCAGGWGGYGANGDARCCSSGYTWDSANKKCCGWAQGTSGTAQKWCTSDGTTCYIQYGNTTQPTCTYALANSTNKTWTTYVGGTGCLPSSRATSGTVYCNGNLPPFYVTVQAIPYTCTCQ